MVIKCPNCGASLEYDPSEKDLFCEHCGSFVNINEPENDEDYKTAGADRSVFDQADIVREILETNVYKCTSCGAELNINGKETSSFCAYCGQPTIVFDRVDGILKPDVIIPFDITKGKAEDILRTKFQKGFFIPKAFKKFTVDRISGIYIPYWLYELEYSDFITVEYSTSKTSLSSSYGSYAVGSGKSKKSYQSIPMHREFKNLACDASIDLNDNISFMIEPYYFELSKPFDISYLSGYYSDRYDISEARMKANAYKKANTLVCQEAMDMVDGGGKRIIKSTPVYHWGTNTRYAYLPAYFMCLQYKGEPYTFAVNGQTGKLVGAMPLDKSKVIVTSLIIFALICLIITFVVIPILEMLEFLGDRLLLQFSIVLFVILIFNAKFAYDSFMKYLEVFDLTKERRVRRYATKRQEK